MDAGRGEPWRLAVGIATRDRPALLADALRDLVRQTRAPDRVLVCYTQPADIGGVPEGAELLLSAPGLPRQRNMIMDAATDCDAVLFLDDDFVMDPGYIQATADALRTCPNLIATTGTVLADDTRGPGLSPEAAHTLLRESPPAGSGFELVRSGYGCNMAIRLSAVRRHGLRFDERLPLYAWSEDVDFTHRAARHGEIAKLHGAVGVHLGTKQGRTPGRKLGYSQVANPIYLFRKGSYTLLHAASSVGRNMAANLALAARPEPYVDRRGRLRGNVLAMADLLRGRLDPGRILEL